MLQKAMPTLLPSPSVARPRAWVGVLAYLVAYVALDWTSYVFPVKTYAITPWNPPAGLSVAFLLLGGLRLAPALLAAALIADLLVRPGGVGAGFSLLSSLVLAAGYMGLVAFLMRVARIDLELRRVRDVGWLVGTVVPVTLAIAAVYVGLHAGAGLLRVEETGPSILRFWIGDMIGVVVTAPALLVVSSWRRAWRPPRAGGAMEVGLQAVVTAAALAVVLGWGAPTESRLFYLLFPPVIWVALRHGLRGVALALLAVQVALILALDVRYRAEDTVLEFQFLMLTLALVGLFLGAATAERARARDDLARSDAELRTVFESVPDGVVTLDAAGRVRTANAAAGRILGDGTAQLVSRPLSGLVPGIPERPMGAASVETSIQRPGGPLRLEVSLSPAPGTDLHIAVLRDVTRRKATEEQLREKQEQLTSVLRFAAAGQVASSMAHELNQPLYALTTYIQACQVLASSPTGDRSQLAELMDKAVQEVARAGEVVHRLREFFQAGTLRLERVGVRRLLDDAAEGVRRRTERHGISLAVECSADTGEVSCDPVQLEIVLHNLLGNAVDAIAAGQAPRREIRLVARGSGSEVAVRVEDSGPGVSEEVSRRLFEPFTTTKPFGMGLGLAISRYIVEAHGGRLWMERLPAGSAFCFALPTEAARGA
jgi:two-component system sensor kinase FixL